MKKFAFFLCLCFLVLPSAGSAQDSPKCSIEAVKAVLTRPNRVQFEVKYNIPPGHPKPCFHQRSWSPAALAHADNGPTTSSTPARMPRECLSSSKKKAAKAVWSSSLPSV